MRSLAVRMVRQAAAVVIVVAAAGGASASPAAAFSASEGTAVTATLGTVDIFCEAPPNHPTGCVYPGVGAVTIDWGDNSTSAGTKTAVQCPATQCERWVISGTHTYAEAGTYTGSFVLSTSDGDNPGDTFGVQIADVPLTPQRATNLSQVAGAGFSATLGSFTDANPRAAPTDFSATINWGDNTPTSMGTVSADPSQGFDVTGSHTYSSPGQFPITVTVHDIGGSSATIGASASVIPPPSGTASPIATIEGTSFSGTVATFSGGPSGAPASAFTATIDWGDGATTAGTVANAAGNTYTVAGTHDYRSAGTYPVTITITVLTITGATGSDIVHGQAKVADAPVTASPSTVTAFAGVPFTGTVATLHDANPFSVASDLAATINWSDGSAATPGTVTGVGIGLFTVTGTHIFPTVGTHLITVAVADHSGAASSTASPVQVGVPPVPVTSITPAPTAPDGSHGWYKRSVHVLVAADGLGVPVSATRCVLDPTGPVGAFDALPAGCPLAGAGGDLINDGTHTISAASANVAGEKEAPVSLTLKIDRTPPTVTCSPGAEFVTGGGGEVVVARVKDATSGPLSSVVSAPASVRTIGAKQARLTGYDNAGNATTVSCPYRVLGHLTSWMDWTFDHYSRYTTVTQLDAERVPIGAVIRLACRGRGCPFVARSIRVAKRSCRGKRCATSSTSGSSTSRTVDLARLLAHRHLAPRTRLVVSITKTNLFGAMWTFTIRPARDPSNTKACLVPGSFAEVFAGC